MPCRTPKDRLSPEESAQRTLTGIKRCYLSLESIESILIRLLDSTQLPPILRNLERTDTKVEEIS